jgi:hypothetical protein
MDACSAPRMARARSRRSDLSRRRFSDFRGKSMIEPINVLNGLDLNRLGMVFIDAVESAEIRDLNR